MYAEPMAMEDQSTAEATYGMPSCVMYDLSPSWEKESIALLLGKWLHSTNSSKVSCIPSGSVVVEMLACKKASDPTSRTSLSQATIIFSSKDEQRRVVQAYEGLAVPMTHGYHYYRFSENADVGNRSEGGSSPSHAETPPLHLQLMAVPTKELARRVQKLCKPMTTDGGDADESQIVNEKKRKGSNKRCRVHTHALQCFQLCQKYEHSRPQRRVLGFSVPPGSTDALLKYLRTCTLWPPPEKQRKGVSAGNYLTVRKQHPPEHDIIWNLCRDLIILAVPAAVYSALAITKAFVGSPHIDNHDTTFQHVIAVGDFEGGMLCAEADEDGTETLAIDVRNRFGRIEGRAVHWVSGWEGERYSVVYYSTAKDDYTDRVPQCIHTEWMEANKESRST